MSGTGAPDVHTSARYVRARRDSPQPPKYGTRERGWMMGPVGSVASDRLASEDEPPVHSLSEAWVLRNSAVASGPACSQGSTLRTALGSVDPIAHSGDLGPVPPVKSHRHAVRSRDPSNLILRDDGLPLTQGRRRNVHDLGRQFDVANLGGRVAKPEGDGHTREIRCWHRRIDVVRHG